MTSKSALVPNSIENQIHLVRGQKVLLDADLAVLYNVEVRALIQAVHAQSHEISHTTAVGHAEAAATINGVTSAIWFGMNHFTGMDGKTAALAVLDAIAPQLSLYGNNEGTGQFQRFAELIAQRHFRVALAEQELRLLKPDRQRGALPLAILRILRHEGVDQGLRPGVCGRRVDSSARYGQNVAGNLQAVGELQTQVCDRRIQRDEFFVAKRHCPELFDRFGVSAISLCHDAEP